VYIHIYIYHTILVINLIRLNVVTRPVVRVKHAGTFQHCCGVKCTLTIRRSQDALSRHFTSSNQLQALQQGLFWVFVAALGSTLFLTLSKPSTLCPSQSCLSCSLNPSSLPGAMCRKTTCGKCGKPTWAGCGNHIDSVCVESFHAVLPYYFTTRVKPKTRLYRTTPYCVCDYRGQISGRLS
jgi:hypothetical protein